MHPAKVVPRHVKRDGMFQVLQFPAMSIGEASKTPELASQGQVGTFDMRRGNVTRIGSAVFDAWDRSRNPACGTVPLRATDVMAGKQFDEHRVIGTSSEVFLNRRHVPA